MVANLSLSGSGRKGWWGGRLFEAGRLFEVGANSRLGAYSRSALIRGWVLIRINTVNKLEERETEFNLAQRLRLRAAFHTSPLFHLRAYAPENYVSNTVRKWKAVLMP